jgi:hypothetical protein
MNPYANLPESSFWSRAVSQNRDAVDPVVEPKFRIARNDRIASVGSCFAQHISRALVGKGFNYLVTETAPATPGAQDENFGVFSARYGNIYTIRQLLQLFQRAYGLFEPKTLCWTTEEGRCLDPFRPQIQKRGFVSAGDVSEDRASHLSTVRLLFETCDVMIFTLGLTEGWANRQDGAVVPVAPGVLGVDDPDFAFANFSVTGMVEDLTQFISKLRVVNSGARVLLTVSPVPLVATYETRHVLVSTVYSKSALRVVAEAVAATMPDVDYFPSYEIIVGPQARGRYFAADARTVTPEGVEQVMSIFSRHYLTNETRRRTDEVVKLPVDDAEIEKQYETVCDEEALDG